MLPFTLTEFIQLLYKVDFYLAEWFLLCREIQLHKKIIQKIYLLHCWLASSWIYMKKKYIYSVYNNKLILLQTLFIRVCVTNQFHFYLTIFSKILSELWWILKS